MEDRIGRRIALWLWLRRGANNLAFSFSFYKDVFWWRRHLLYNDIHVLLFQVWSFELAVNVYRVISDGIYLQVIVQNVLEM